MRKTPQLGLSASDLKTVPFAHHYNPDVRPPQTHVLEALIVGPLASELFPPLGMAGDLTAPGYARLETGYSICSNFGFRVHCLTDMPRVTPAMWDWWFGWHGCDGRRYKLWHPQAHVDARWADGRDDETYVGRTSLVSEYIGSSCVKASISFVRPSVLGIDESNLAAQGAVAICARLGNPDVPIKGGWLAHHIRPTDTGCEMRSRFWIGGETVGPGSMHRPGLRFAMLPFRPLAKIMAPNPRDLLAHCGQEMSHLAGLLPDLFAEFGPQQKGEAA